MSLQAAAAVQTGWLGIDSGDWLAAITNMLAIIIAVVIAARIAPKAEERRSRRDQQERLLRVLISTAPMPANPEYQGAIGLIPLDFKGNKRVLDARHHYLTLAYEALPDEVEAQASHYNRQLEAQSDLIAAMAQEIGFDLTSDALRKGAYVSKGFVDREELFLAAMASWPRIAAALERSNHIVGEAMAQAADQPEQESGGKKGERRSSGRDGES